MKYKLLLCGINLLLCLSTCFSSALMAAETVIDFTGKIKDGQNITAVIRKSIEEAPKADLKFVFPKGVYHFSPAESFKKTYCITNHENGEKNIAFLFDGFRNVKIEGDETEFVFTGAMLPFLFVNSQGIELTGCSIDWSIPFYVQGEVICSMPKSKSYDVRFNSEGYDFQVADNRLVYPNQEGFSYSGIGESLVFDKYSKSPVYNSNTLDIHRKQNAMVEKLSNGDIRITEKIKSYPSVGSIIVFKGPNGENRYAPAIHALKSKDVVIRNVNVYHALGMGFLGEISENISLKNFNVCLREGTDRMLSATADATHFCNCRGNVVVDGCLFENMLDDGTNVHGTYVRIEKIISNRTLQAKLMHFQQGGFEFARPGDKNWFIIAPLINRQNENKIVDYRRLDDYTMELTFVKDLPKELKEGDLVENKTWNTDSFVMKNCTIRNHRARNIVLKTPGKTLIENNYLNSMMASILMRPEAYFWYEAGANENTVIRNNTFHKCILGGGEQAMLFISPRFAKNFDKSGWIDKNVVFENNTIHTFDNKIIHATSVNGLVIRNNKIIQTKDFKPYNPENPLVDLFHCKDVVVKGNMYQFDTPEFIRMDEDTRQTANINQK